MSNDQGLSGVTVTFNATEVSNLESFTGPAFETEQYQVFYIGDVWQRQTPTVRKAGPVSVVVGYDPAFCADLYTAYVAGTIATLEVAFAANTPLSIAASSYSCSAFIGKYEIVGGDAKAQAKVNITFELTGEVTQG